MNAPTTFPEVAGDLDADSRTITEAMRLLDVKRIEDWGLSHFLVELKDGRMGAGLTVGDAYRKALADTGIVVSIAA